MCTYRVCCLLLLQCVCVCFYLPPVLFTTVPFYIHLRMCPLFSGPFQSRHASWSSVFSWLFYYNFHFKRWVVAATSSKQHATYKNAIKFASHSHFSGILHMYIFRVALGTSAHVSESACVGVCVYMCWTCHKQHTFTCVASACWQLLSTSGIIKSSSVASTTTIHLCVWSTGLRPYPQPPPHTAPKRSPT